MAPTNKLNIKVEGWRGVSHSYALVNQFQLLHWHKLNSYGIYHVDMPFIMEHWSKDNNFAGFNDSDFEIINKKNCEQADCNVIYRINAPFNVETPNILPTVTYAVTEFGLHFNTQTLNQIKSYRDAGGKIHTPSKWSGERLISSGIPGEIIKIISHSADHTYFFKMNESEISQHRKNLGYAESDVILLNVGTHHWNKGLDVVITAFAKAKNKNKNLKLLLKDQRSTYLMNSESYIIQILEQINMNNAAITDSIKIINQHLNLAQLNSLYNIADAYLTPYRAEGFNLPALEAQICSTPVIATKGGATDDFLIKENNYFITGNLIENSDLRDDLRENAYIEPHQDNLITILENLERKGNATYPNFNQTWSDACMKISALFQS